MKKRKRSPSARNLIARIQGALSLNLLHSAYAPGDEDWYWACLGHCYVASEALYHLVGKNAGYVPYMFKYPNGTTHWWLANPGTKKVLDPTRPQIIGRFAYSRGRRAAFITRKASKRAAELIRRVKAAGWH